MSIRPQCAYGPTNICLSNVGAWHKFNACFHLIIKHFFFINFKYLLLLEAIIFDQNKIIINNNFFFEYSFNSSFCIIYFFSSLAIAYNIALLSIFFILFYAQCNILYTSIFCPIFYTNNLCFFYESLDYCLIEFIILIFCSYICPLLKRMIGFAVRVMECLVFPWNILINA